MRMQPILPQYGAETQPRSKMEDFGEKNGIGIIWQKGGSTTSFEILATITERAKFWEC